jgi:hypothetical protein
MPWTFQQSTGKLTRPDGTLAATGYAGGNIGDAWDAKWVNNPNAQCVHNCGPLPRGTYYMQDPIEHSRVGAYAIPLKPDPANDMCKRGDFYCHGDLIADPGHGSEGCIVMPRPVREAMWKSDDHTVSVVR